MPMVFAPLLAVEGAEGLQLVGRLHLKVKGLDHFEQQA